MPRTLAIVALAATGLFTFTTSAVTAETITVCGSGCDHTSIQSAINASSNGDVINIAAGTYNEHSLTTAGKVVIIQGAVAKDGTLGTTVDALQLGTVFEFQDGETNETIVKDLIVTGGQATWGGGIHIQNASPTIEYCVITQNTATNNGGGIHCIYSEAVIRHCEITDNFGGSGGGVSNGVGTATTIEDCLITGNVSTLGWGGGLRFAVQSQVNLRNCTINDNTCTAGDGWGGGLYINNCPAASIIACTFRNNRAQSGGGFCILGTSEGVTVDGCSFSGNVATSSGGGVYNTSTPTLTDSTLCGNSPEQIPGDYIDGSDNCIVESCEDADDNGVPDGCEACVGDVNGDGLVDAADLGLLIGAWGTADPAADINGDGSVDAADLGLLIGAWGLCP